VDDRDLWAAAIAEFIGPFALVVAGVGAIISTQNLADGGNLVAVALAHGLAIGLMVAALGHISGGQFNPAVTVSMLMTGEIGLTRAISYIIAQVVGAIIAAAIIVVIANGVDGFSVDESGLGANGFADRSPGLYNWGACLLAEVVLTFFFLLVILGVTGRDALTSFAPLAIGLALTLIHLISIPVTNTSVNPARSTGPAVFVGGWALTQLWMFWVAPIIGAVLAGLVHYYVIEERAETEVGYGEAVPSPDPAPG
jgi:aquaporin Z